MYCPSCGAENEDGAKFCQGCGANMAEPSAEGAPSGEPPPPVGETPPPTPPPEPSAPRPSGELDIGGWISKGFSEVFGKDFGGYLILSLVVVILSGITFSILGGPLLAGSLKIIRRKLRGQGGIDVGAAVSEGFAVFLPSFLLVFLTFVAIWIIVVILQVIPIIGQLLALLISLAMCILWPFFAVALHFITEEKKDFWPAAQEAMEVIKTNLVMYWLFGLVAGIIASIGSVICGIGVFVTVPVALVMLSMMLESQYPPK